jgi:hypothetical protein
MTRKAESKGFLAFLNFSIVQTLTLKQIKYFGLVTKVTLANILLAHFCKLNF